MEVHAFTKHQSFKIVISYVVFFYDVNLFKFKCVSTFWPGFLL